VSRKPGKHGCPCVKGLAGPGLVTLATSRFFFQTAVRRDRDAANIAVGFFTEALGWGFMAAQDRVDNGDLRRGTFKVRSAAAHGVTRWGLVPKYDRFSRPRRLAGQHMSTVEVPLRWDAPVLEGLLRWLRPQEVKKQALVFEEPFSSAMASGAI